MVHPAKFKSLFELNLSSLFESRNKINTNLIFLIGTVSYGCLFFSKRVHVPHTFPLAHKTQQKKLDL